MDASTRTIARRLGLLASTLAVAMVLLLAPPVGASTGGIFVYTGNNPISQVTDYTEFAQAADRTLDTASTWPSELSDYACVILPTNQNAFDEAAKAALRSYIDGGGTVLALGEHLGFSGAVSTMNDLASSLDSGLSLVAADIDQFTVTEDIEDTPWTQGVTSLGYASGSELVADAPAEVLVNYRSGPAMLGAEQIGDGLFVLGGDSNLFATYQSFAHYTEHDNGVLAHNLCGQQEGAAVAALLADAADTIRQMNLNRGIERSLIAKLDAAAANLDAEDVAGACDALQDLRNQVDALDGGRHLTTEQAETIRTDVNAIRDALDC